MPMPQLILLQASLFNSEWPIVFIKEKQNTPADFVDNMSLS